MAIDAELRYVEDCGNEHQRERKGLGPLNSPGAFLSGKILKIVRLKQIKVPETPKDHLKDSANG